MAFAHYLLAVPVETSNSPLKASILSSSSHSSYRSLFSIAHSSSSSSSLNLKPRNLSLFPKLLRIGHKGIIIIIIPIFVAVNCKFVHYK